MKITRKVCKDAKKLLNNGAGTSFTGTDLLGEKRTWNNADFIPLPKHCQDYLNGKYRF